LKYARNTFKSKFILELVDLQFHQDFDSCPGDISSARNLLQTHFCEMEICAMDLVGSPTASAVETGISAEHGQYMVNF